MLREIRPDSIAAPAANYAHAVEAAGVRRWLHTAGVVPTLPDGSVPDGLAAQAVAVWTNIDAILAEAAMTASDIVSVTTYVVAGNELAPAMTARDDFMGDHRAASTLVTVPELAQAAWKLEIAIVAAAD
jgi:enamine deaminase RidA (YjgF/YER057c/UK114 family)